METAAQYNYEDKILDLNDIFDQIESAIENNMPFSIGRYGHGEIAFLGQKDFNDAYYAGATVSAEIISADLLEAIKATDIVGLHFSWGYSEQDRIAAERTKKLLSQFNIKPAKVCSAYISHEMIEHDRFWECLKGLRVALVGRRAEEACPMFQEKGVNIVYTTGFEGYLDMERVCDELSKREDWDIVLLAAGIPGSVLAPRIAQMTKKVAIDFGHALDLIIDKESFDYPKLVKEWQEKKENKVLVSIVMAVYNGAEFLKEAIDSALAQTYKCIEIIIVNDGSTDATKEILDNITDYRIKVIHLEQNQGAANALNTGIIQSNGSWIAILDADDIFYPAKIEEQVKHVLLHPELMGVGTFINCIPSSAEVSKGFLHGVESYKNFFVASKDIRKEIYWACPLTHSSVMFRKDAFMEVGGYDTDFKIAYDYDLWIKLLEKGEIENIPKILLSYRIHMKSLSNKNGLETMNEIQLASSRGIYRLMKNGGSRQPRVAVVGPLKAYQNYLDKIAPKTNLIVEFLNNRDLKSKVIAAIKEIRIGKMDGLIILGKTHENMLEKTIKNYLELNKNLFVLYNILM